MSSHGTAHPLGRLGIRGDEHSQILEALDVGRGRHQDHGPGAIDIGIDDAETFVTFSPAVTAKELRRLSHVLASVLAGRFECDDAIPGTFGHQCIENLTGLMLHEVLVLLIEDRLAGIRPAYTSGDLYVSCVIENVESHSAVVVPQGNFDLSRFAVRVDELLCRLLIFETQCLHVFLLEMIVNWAVA